MKRKHTVNTHPLQSKEWENFRNAWGNKILLSDYGLITLHRIPFTKYWIGIFEKGPKPSAKMLLDLKKVGKENDLIFIKLEPNVPIKVGGEWCIVDSEKESIHHTLSPKHNVFPGKTLFTPTTFWIDLKKSEEDLMKSFSGKTRYNIRLAQKHGVKVVEDSSPKAFQKYLQLTFETTKRQGFHAHTPKYHKLMWKHLHKNPVANGQQPIAHLLTATYNNEVITTWILFAYKGVLYYPYGASSDKYKEVMANNLMMWEAIKFGKKLGLSTFDLWGREPGKGFTRFKEGYNPEVIEFLGSWDLVIHPALYKIYRAAETIRWAFLKMRSKL